MLLTAARSLRQETEGAEGKSGLTLYSERRTDSGPTGSLRRTSCYAITAANKALIKCPLPVVITISMHFLCATKGKCRGSEVFMVLI